MEKILGNLTCLGKAGKALLLINYFISFKAKDFRRIKKNLSYSACHSYMLSGLIIAPVTLALMPGVWSPDRISRARKHLQAVTIGTF